MKNLCETCRGWGEPLSADMSFVFSEELHFNCFTALCWENWYETGWEGPWFKPTWVSYSADMSTGQAHFRLLRRFLTETIWFKYCCALSAQCISWTFRRFFTENICFMYCCALAAQTISWNLAAILYRKHLFYVLQELSSGRLAKRIFWTFRWFLTENNCFKYWRKPFSDACAIWRRDSREGLLSTPGAFVDRRWRMFRHFSQLQEGVKQWRLHGFPSRDGRQNFSDPCFSSRELRCNSTLSRMARTPEIEKCKGFKDFEDLKTLIWIMVG